MIFRRDAHSEIGPQWQLAAPDDAALVLDVLRRRFGIDAVGPVEQATGGTINSRNYRVGSAGVVVKRKTAIGAYAAALRVAEASKLFPPHLRACDGAAYVEESDGIAWIAMRYVAGNTFGGFEFQYEAALSAVSELADRLATASALGLVVRPVLDEAALYWCERVVGVGQYISRAEIVELRRRPLQVCHIDLHPHNMLFDGDWFASFLDVDSIQMALPAAAYGYAVFKLTRQHIVGGGVRLSLARQRVLAGLVGCDLTVDGARAGATVEILRRIAYIVEAERRGPCAWRLDLPRHVTALAEIDELFA